MKNINELLEECFMKKKGYLLIEVPEDTWKTWKKSYKSDKMSHEKKREILDRFGYRKLKDEQWG